MQQKIFSVIICMTYLVKSSSKFQKLNSEIYQPWNDLKFFIMGFKQQTAIWLLGHSPYSQLFIIFTEQ